MQSKLMRRSIVYSMALAAAFVSSTSQAAPITGGTGPGGVGLTSGASNLAIWLKADAIGQADNTAVPSWVNSRTGGVNATQGTGANQPLFRTNILNGQPVVRYDGVNDSLSTSFIMGGTSAASSFAVTRQTVSNHGLPFITTSPPYFGIHSNNDGVNQSYSTYGPGNTGATHVNGVVPGTLPLGSYGILSGSHSGYTGGQQTASYTLPIGADLCCAGRFLNGDIAEVAVFNTALNAAQRTIVENALSAKYGIALNTGGGALDIYAGDAPGSGNYDRDMFAVGQLGGAAHANAGAAGFGIEATGGLTDGEFIAAGHRSTANGLVAAEGTGGAARWDRVWYVDSTGAVDVALSFDASDAAAAFDIGEADLFFSATDPYSFTELGLTPVINGDTVTFNLAGFNQDGYFTLGFSVAPLAPEPGSVALFAAALGVLGLHLRRRRHR